MALNKLTLDLVTFPEVGNVITTRPELWKTKPGFRHLPPDELLENYELLKFWLVSHDVPIVESVRPAADIKLLGYRPDDPS